MSVHDFIYMFISSVVALFPVINPIGNGFIINGFLDGLDSIQRKQAIKHIITNCLIIALGCLIAGHLILLLFGLAVPVIQVGGGILICKTGWEWLADSTSTDIDSGGAADRLSSHNIEKKLFYPIAFPITIGAGTISVIFTLMATAEVKGNFLHTGLNYVMIALAIATILVILYLFLSQGPRIMKRLGSTGNLIINKLVAFITFCIGIQIIFTGISKIFHLDIL